MLSGWVKNTLHIFPWVKFTITDVASTDLSFFFLVFLTDLHMDLLHVFWFSSGSSVRLWKQGGDCSWGREELLQTASYLAPAAAEWAAELRCNRYDRQQTLWAALICLNYILISAPAFAVITSPLAPERELNSISWRALMLSERSHLSLRSPLYPRSLPSLICTPN